MRTRLIGCIAVLLLVALPTFAADRSIQSGIDLWRTPGNGQTFIDFKHMPIPSGFFCFKSAPFAGRINFAGVPVATAEAGVLGRADTIVQRLDEAVFNRNGVARTRVQVRALHFLSVKPIQTACGAFNVEVRLSGQQPITGMKIVRENEHGGRFFAPIAVNGKLVFTPVGRPATEILEMPRNVRFPANQGIFWADLRGKTLQRDGYVLTDTDNDRVPDSYLPGTSSNFAAGVRYNPTRGALEPLMYQNPNCHLVNSYEAYLEGHCPAVEPTPLPE
ncbi:MAG TPA: hypothetical protein VN851_08395 [Thermoanaerobaculia bacterium]|nr:hypothetical protein [Thermoanaerobaculia bacterium]